MLINCVYRYRSIYRSACMTKRLNIITFEEKHIFIQINFTLNHTCIVDLKRDTHILYGITQHPVCRIRPLRLTLNQTLVQLE